MSALRKTCLFVGIGIGAVGFFLAYAAVLHVAVDTFRHSLAREIAAEMRK